MCLSIWSQLSVGQTGLLRLLLRMRKSATNRASPGVFFGTAKAFEAQGVGWVAGSNIPASRQFFISCWKPALRCHGTSNGFTFWTGFTSVFSFWYKCTGGTDSLSYFESFSLKVLENLPITLDFNFWHSSWLGTDLAVCFPNELECFVVVLNPLL